MRKVTVPKEKAVFWLDRNGYWHNEHGLFQHRKVIDYFHSAIRRDEEGYHLFQKTDEFEEKVYFPHEDTALFVFGLSLTPAPTITLNTRRCLALELKHLFIRNDHLYVRIGDEEAKFTGKALMTLSKHLEEEGERTALRIGENRVIIPEL